MFLSVVIVRHYVYLGTNVQFGIAEVPGDIAVRSSRKAQVSHGKKRRSFQYFPSSPPPQLLPSQRGCVRRRTRAGMRGPRGPSRNDDRRVAERIQPPRRLGLSGRNGTTRNIRQGSSQCYSGYLVPPATESLYAEDLSPTAPRSKPPERAMLSFELCGSENRRLVSFAALPSSSDEFGVVETNSCP